MLIVLTSPPINTYFILYPGHTVKRNSEWMVYIQVFQNNLQGHFQDSSRSRPGFPLLSAQTAGKVESVHRGVLFAKTHLKRLTMKIFRPSRTES